MTHHLRPSLLCALFVSLLAPRLVSAQGIYPYTISRDSAAFGSIVNQPSATVLQAIDLTPIRPGLNPEQEGLVTIALPFDFSFFGETYDEVTVYLNGVMSFEDPARPLGSILRPASAVPSADDDLNAFIAPQWEDFVMVQDSRVAHLTVGTPGSRRFIVEWSLLEVSGQPNTDTSFQVELRESDQSIRVLYGPSAAVNQATAAVEGPVGRDGFNLLDCEAASCSFADFNGDNVNLTLPSQIDLTGRTEAPFGATPGTSFDATLFIQNGGQTPSPGGAWTLSIAPVGMTSGAVNIGSGSFGALGPISQTEINRSFSVPAGQPIGAFDLLLEIDPSDDIPEFREDNNELFGPGFGTGPDLVGRFGPLGSQVGPGGQLQLDLELASEGAPTRRAFDVDFRLTGAADNLVASLGRQRFVIADGVRETIPVSLSIPSSVPIAQLVRVEASLDSTSRIPEIRELNNEVQSSLVPSRPANPRIPSVGVQVRPPFYRGQPFQLEFTVSNGGPAPANGLDICIVLGERELLRIPNQNLPPSAPPRIYRVEPVIPTSFSVGEGNLDLVIDVDCNDEFPTGGPLTQDEADNTFTIREVGIEAPSADLVPEIAEQALAGEAGEPLPLRVRVFNRGILDSGFEGTIELVGPDTMRAFSFDFDGPDLLRPGEEADIQLQVPLPNELASGMYTPRLLLQPTNPEERSENNQTSGADVAVSGFGVALVQVDPFPAILGQPYSFRFGLLGGSPRSYELRWPDGPPPGLSFDDGEIFGTPTELGGFPFELQVDTDLGPITVDGSLPVLTPALPLTVVDGALPPALVDELYRERITVLGGRPPYQITSPIEPAGLDLQSNGTLVGSCPSPSSVLIPVEVVDEVGSSVMAEVAFECVGRGGIQIDLPALPDGLVDREYGAQATVSGGEPPYEYRLEGELPPGIEFDPASGRFSGTPERAGDFRLFVEVRDAQGRLDRNPFNLRVFEAGSLQILSPGNAFPEGEVGEAYPPNGGSFEVELTGANPERPLIWMLADAGALPPGLSFEDGAVSGTPTEAGLYPFTIIVTDESADISRRFFAIRIRGAGQDPSASAPDDGCRQVPPSTGMLFVLLLIVWAGLRKRGLR